jgi:hypothetical protein
VPAIPETKKSFKVTNVRPRLEDGKRVITQTSLVCHVEGAACPHPDTSDADTLIAGAKARYCRRPPTPKRRLLREFDRFVSEWLTSNLVPLSPHTDLELETWLAQTNYPEWRKQELRESWEECNMDWDDLKNTKCGAFGKRETYPEFKHSRTINARVDPFKCLVGPLMKEIEKELFKGKNTKKYFIKRVPIAKRPDYIMEQVYQENGIYMATDYSSFEASFTDEFMDHCEFMLYEYMSRHVPDGGRLFYILRKVMGGANVCQYRDFVVRVRGTRMSGEMCTSLGNGFANLMLMLFLTKKNGNTNVRGVIEGDDGLFSMTGPLPTADMFADLGFNIKIDIHKEINTASFCGMIFDLEERTNVADPRKYLATFGWTSERYSRSRGSVLKSLLRCKALSLAHQAPGCPILSSLAHYALRVTRGCDVRGILERRTTGHWMREKLLFAVSHKVPSVAPGIRTRFLVEQQYGISVEVQIEIEAYLDSLNELKPLDHPFILDLMDPIWNTYYDLYAVQTSRLDPHLEHPFVVWGKPFPGG